MDKSAVSAEQNFHARCYAALQARDQRFDGQFYVGVKTTGIYCRPTCRVRLPKFENCRFFPSGESAIAFGFRACLRCRPELLPCVRVGQETHLWSSEDATLTLAKQALRLIQKGVDKCDWSVQTVANTLGITDRHLRRIFKAQFGVAPLAYGLALRDQMPLTLHLPYTQPYTTSGIQAFFSLRAIAGVEYVDAAGSFWRVWRAPPPSKHQGWLCIRWQDLSVQVSASLLPVLGQVTTQLRAVLDLTANQAAIHPVLGRDYANTQTWRVPGCFDEFELCVRAVLGQQITVKAACTLAERLVSHFGSHLKEPKVEVGLTHLFPTPQQLLRATPDALGALGITKARQLAIHGLAAAFCNGFALTTRAADWAQQCADLHKIAGIGPWTVQYIAMRAMRDPDAWPAGDIALQKALNLHPSELSTMAKTKACERASKQWQPWRSYAVIRAWNLLNDPKETT